MSDRTFIPCCRGRWVALFVWLVAAGTLGGATAQGQVVDRVDFETEIQPILSDRCYKCHGPDQEHREADLRLDDRESAMLVIEPGDADSSDLVWRIESEDEDERMPPPDSNLKLTGSEQQLIRRWIEQGANWRDHWAFVPIPRQVDVPQLTGDDWSRSPIDRFIYRRLIEQGLAPTEPASKARLLRRLSFDLTGLPPTLEELDAFLADTDEDAYERQVDRLLARPAFAERVAAEWLDAARYSDTYGYQVDRERYVWPWRDWVVRAIDRNMPYDQFLVEQLAGDLLPNATDEQVLATTFNRLHPQKVEGGSVPEEFRVEYVCDRIQTFATSMMGLTLGCARCHDHKFDPMTQREYYQLFAFFDDIDEAGLYSYFTGSVPTPTLFLWDEAQKRTRAELREAVAQAEAEFEQWKQGRRPAFEEWLKTWSATSNEDAAESSEKAIGGELELKPFESWALRGNRRVDGPGGAPAIEFTGDDEVNLSVGNFKRYEPFSISAWLYCPDEKQRAVIYHRSRAWTDAGSRGYELLLIEGHLQASLIHFWPGNALSVRGNDPLPLNRWVHVGWVYDGSGRAEGLKLFVDGSEVDCQVIRDQLQKNITGGGGDHLTLGARFRDRGFTEGRLSGVRVFRRALAPIEVAELNAPGRFNALRSRSNDWSDSDRESLWEYFLAAIDGPTRDARQRVQEARRAWCEFHDRSAEIMVMRELPEPRQAFFLERGQYDQRRDPVGPGTPDFLPRLEPGQPLNRLTLARWLVSESHPLTARVAANRFWQMIFGRGLVRTQEDFGRQGSPPTHPDLLDWLARDFVEHGWDVKRLVKQIVMSRTYRQDSTADVESLKEDPENLWLGRAPSFRWPAEMLRDNALAVSGLLVDRLGGAPGRPYDLAESFRPAQPDGGDGVYRRSLYTYWVRTDPAPAMLTLDAAKRDVCTMRRERTASPLQGLVLLNGTQFVEAARALAWRVWQTHPGDSEGMANELFRRLTSRKPSDIERNEILELARRLEAQFQAAPQAAEQLLGVGRFQPGEPTHTTQNDPTKTGESSPDGLDDLTRQPATWAAWTLVASALFNHDECLTRR